jgi:hypothetical protein
MAARIARGRVTIGLTVASSTLANVVERLCDHGLSEAERERSTDQLYGAMADVRLALAELGELVGAGAHGGEGAVVHVSPARFRRHLWSRRT